jgi:hypothetical protein
VNVWAAIARLLAWFVFVLIIATAAVVWCLVVLGLPASKADTDPTPWQVPGGPQIGGVQVWPRVCGEYPPACGMHWRPDTQTWQPPREDD